MSRQGRRKGRGSSRTERWRRTGVWVAVMVAVAAVAGVIVAGGVLGWGGAASSPSIRHVHGMAVDPGDPNRLWVATHDGLLVWEEPGGWRGRVGPVADLMGFSAGPDGRLYASGHPGPQLNLDNPLGLARSEDGGRTWEPVSLEGVVDFHAMAVSPAHPGLIYGYFYGDGQLYRSEDGGQTWTRTPASDLAGPRGLGPLQLVAHPTDPATLLAAGENGLLLSTDGGRTWERLRDGVVTAAAFVPGTDRGTILVYDAAEGLLRSTDGGRTWQPAGSGLRVDPQDPLAALAARPDAPQRIYAITMTGTLWRSTDGGGTWETIGAPQ
ncbi:F510_1955 family glycosylhydrolase [Thermaerobacter subterraneus]|uniref:Glycosyl hydrolase family 33/family 58 n=1 Tax=Thermaerobacter subterraneus DSM 13965 TaxID=867903 RepID=K6QF21_9FIRM|nr:exo-alpha-sialidase [Thermaerobacter subterraneus]EKP95516.1 glycosyl hydrolase family 33/family 58 [Thermaerobacter subterraneus DSM 13965]